MALLLKSVELNQEATNGLATLIVSKL